MYIKRLQFTLKEIILGVLGGLVVGILGLLCHDPGSVLNWGTEILKATRYGKKINK